jgi:hypothetical protein
MANDVAKSERMVIQSPTSMRGAFKRVANLRHRLPAEWPPVVRVAVMVPIYVLAVVAGALGLIWTVVLGVLAWPWRIMRRGSRKRKVEAQRHREMMATMQARE